MGTESHHLFVSSHAVAAAHIEKLEGLTTRMYNHILWLGEGKKKEREKDLQHMLVQAESFQAKQISLQG